MPVLVSMSCAEWTDSSAKRALSCVTASRSLSASLANGLLARGGDYAVDQLAHLRHRRYCLVDGLPRMLHVTCALVHLAVGFGNQLANLTSRLGAVLG